MIDHDRLILGFVDTYLRLNYEEKEMYQAELEKLGEALLEFASVEDLAAWLAAL